MWGIILGLVFLVVMGIVGILIVLKVIPNPVDTINKINNTPETDLTIDTTKLSNADLIKNIKKNAMTDEIAQSYLDGGEIDLEKLSNAILQKLYFMKGIELRYIFGIVPVIIDPDYDFVVKSFNKDTKSFGGTPITDSSATGYTDYILIRDKTDKLKRLWKLTTSNPYPDDDLIFYNNITSLK